MFRSVVGLALAVGLVGCGSGSTDETVDLQPRALAPQQRIGFDVDGAQTGMTPQQVIAVWQQRHPPETIEIFHHNHAGEEPIETVRVRDGDDELSATFSGAPSGNRAYSLERSRRFNPGVARTALMETFRKKLGVLVQPEPVEVQIVGSGKQMKGPDGIWIAGEGVTEDGVVLKRCLERDGFKLWDEAGAECGLMAEALLGNPDEPPLADYVRLEVHDYRLRRQLLDRDAAAESAVEAAREKARLEGAEKIDSF